MAKTKRGLGKHSRVEPDPACGLDALETKIQKIYGFIINVGQVS